MRRKLMIGAAFAGALMSAPVAAHAYYGGWYYNDNRDGWEILMLSNGSGSFRELSGTAGWCSQPGSSYATMRSTLSGAGGGPVNWWIDADCGDVVRVCIQNAGGRTRCSSYMDYGWK